MGPTPGYVPKTPFANVKSNGCSSSPPRTENWKCGSRLLRIVLTWKSYFCASNAEFFTSRLFDRAMETASSSVRSGMSCAPCWANDPTGDAKTRIERSSARWFDFIILLPGLRLRPDGTLNFERMAFSLVCTKIAGTVPTWSSLQVLESEVRASKNAGECPHLVDGRCPHTGT